MTFTKDQDIPENRPWHKTGAGQMRNGYRRIMCTFDPETFKEIRDKAGKKHISFAEQVRQLVEYALEEDF